jgi:hypothetical protein
LLRRWWRLAAVAAALAAPVAAAASVKNMTTDIIHFQPSPAVDNAAVVVQIDAIGWATMAAANQESPARRNCCASGIHHWHRNLLLL